METCRSDTKKPKGFVLYNKAMNLVCKLDDASCGKVTKASIDFFRNGVIPDDMSLAEDIVFSAICEDIVDNNERYEKICEKRRKAIEKRWQESRKDTNEYNSIQEDTNVYKSIDMYTSDTNTNPSTNPNPNTNPNSSTNPNPNTNTNPITNTNPNPDNIYNIGKNQKKFLIPTLEEVKKYCESRNKGVDADKFYDFYQSKGWMVGKNKMKDWRACCRTWERNDDLKTPDVKVYRELEEGELPF